MDRKQAFDLVQKFSYLVFDCGYFMAKNEMSNYLATLKLREDLRLKLIRHLTTNAADPDNRDG